MESNLSVVIQKRVEVVFSQTDLSNFVIGAIGAIAPESLRLYRLKTSSAFKWSPAYILFSIPFAIVGGVIALVAEPTTRWAAFYTGLTAPVLLATAMRDAAKIEIEGQKLEGKLDAERKKRLEMQAQVYLAKKELGLRKKQLKELSEQTGIEVENTVVARPRIRSDEENLVTYSGGASDQSLKPFKKLWEEYFKAL